MKKLSDRAKVLITLIHQTIKKHGAIGASTYWWPCSDRLGEWHPLIRTFVSVHGPSDARIINSFVDKGWAERHPEPWKKYVVRLTDEGRRIAAECEPDVLKMDSKKVF